MYIKGHEFRNSKSRRRAYKKSRRNERQFLKTTKVSKNKRLKVKELLPENKSIPTVVTLGELFPDIFGDNREQNNQRQ